MKGESRLLVCMFFSLVSFVNIRSFFPFAFGSFPRRKKREKERTSRNKKTSVIDSP